MDARGVVRGLVVLWVLWACPKALADQNIWAGDLKRAQSHLQSAQERLAQAQTTIAQEAAAQPALERRHDRLGRITFRKQRQYYSAQQRADVARGSALSDRAAAALQVHQVQAEHARARAHWRADRARWLSWAAALLALACAGAILVITGSLRRRHDRDGADRAAPILGLAVAAYLIALLAGLSAVDAFVFSWWAVGAGSLVLLMPAAFAVGWRRPHWGQRGTRAARALIPAAGLAALAAAAPVAVAATRPAPHMARLSQRTLALANAHDLHLPLPARVQVLIDRANQSNAHYQEASDAEQQAADALQASIDSQRQAQGDRDRAAHAVSRWSHEVDDVQAQYDDFQQLLDDSSSIDGYDPSVDIPDTTYDPGAPTTEDFGSGSGSVGTCADGTLSDSIGRPGACSHHGGVAG
jgi:hypothetical protein